MSLFKTKKQKEIEQKIMIKKTISSIERYIDSLEKHKTKYLNIAKEAKLNGSQREYNIALSGFKTIYSQQTKAKEMLLNLELTSQVKEMTQITSSFLTAMNNISHEMTKLSKNMDFGKTHNEFEKSIENVSLTSENIDMLIEQSSQIYTEFSNEHSEITDEEIEKFILGQTDIDNCNIDKEIEEATNNIKKELEKM